MKEENFYPLAMLCENNYPFELMVRTKKGRLKLSITQNELSMKTGSHPVTFYEATVGTQTGSSGYGHSEPSYSNEYKNFATLEQCWDWFTNKIKEVER